MTFPRFRYNYFLVLLPLLLLPLFLLSAHRASFRPRPATPSSKCGPIILITAPRHGSTWLLNCVHNCSFSTNGWYKDIHGLSELWNHQLKKRVYKLSVDEALVYVKTMSLKLFPLTLWYHKKDTEAFLRGSKQKIVLLRRDLEEAERSFRKANETWIWNVDTGGVRGSVRTWEDGPYGEQVEAFFGEMRKMMRRVGRQWSEVRYEDVVQEEIIWVGDCWVRNCNKAAT